MNLKNILVATMLLVSCAQLTAQSDKKYEYGEVSLSAGNSAVIIVTQQGRQEFKIENGEVAQVAVIKKINELSYSGWEVYNVSECPAGATSLAYFIKKVTKPEIAQKQRTTTWR